MGTLYLANTIVWKDDHLNGNQHADSFRLSADFMLANTRCRRHPNLLNSRARVLHSLKCVISFLNSACSITGNSLSPSKGVSLVAYYFPLVGSIISALACPA